MAAGCVDAVLVLGQVGVLGETCATLRVLTFVGSLARMSSSMLCQLATRGEALAAPWLVAGVGLLSCMDVFV